MKTVYNSNSVPTSSPNVEMDVDALETKEVAFTLVTNKKRNKRKAKVPSLPSTNSRSKILLVSKALSISKTITISVASKLVTTCSFSAVAATITSKPT